mmetsp:Transcript_25762/g.51284  ORF Transcript_25762/g.51284 Transcript_25762/m.51284 type:complete len:206 (-) Transcript_25762:954-1571(-)
MYVRRRLFRSPDREHGSGSASRPKTCGGQRRKYTRSSACLSVFSRSCSRRSISCGGHRRPLPSRWILARRRPHPRGRGIALASGPSHTAPIPRLRARTQGVSTVHGGRIRGGAPRAIRGSLRRSRGRPRVDVSSTEFARALSPGSGGGQQPKAQNHAKGKASSGRCSGGQGGGCARDAAADDDYPARGPEATVGARLCRGTAYRV